MDPGQESAGQVGWSDQGSFSALVGSVHGARYVRPQHGKLPLPFAPVRGNAWLEFRDGGGERMFEPVNVDLRAQSLTTRDRRVSKLVFDPVTGYFSGQIEDSEWAYPFAGLIFQTRLKGWGHLLFFSGSVEVELVEQPVE